jgi:hypothetical protein
MCQFHGLGMSVIAWVCQLHRLGMSIPLHRYSAPHLWSIRLPDAPPPPLPPTMRSDPRIPAIVTAAVPWMSSLYVSAPFSWNRVRLRNAFRGAKSSQWMIVFGPYLA